MLNPFRNVNLVPNNESRSSYHAHDDYDSESEESVVLYNRRRGNLRLTLRQNDTDTELTYQQLQSGNYGTLNTKLQCENLLVAASQEANEFVENYVWEQAKEEQQVTSPKNDAPRRPARVIASVRYGEKATEFLYVTERDDGRTLVLTVDGSHGSTIDPTQMMPITQLLFHVIEARNVVVMDSLPVHEFKSVRHTTEDIEMPMVFRMQTTHAAKDFSQCHSSVTNLPVSNIVSGFGAAVMTYCEAHGKSGFMYLSLVESVRNVACIKAYSKVWPVEQDVLNKPLKRRHNAHERLYM